MGTPDRAPSVEEICDHPVVQAALDQAWADSLADDPQRRHEEGGWIYMDTRDGEISVRRAQAGLQSELNLEYPPEVS